MTAQNTHPEQFVHIHRWTTDLATNRMESPCVGCGKEWAEYAEECGAATSGKPDGLSSTGVPVQISDAAPRDHYDGFSRLTTNQREMVVRKLDHLCRYAEHIDWAHKYGRFEHCWYVMPERLALSIARLQQYVMMLPEPLAEVAQLERDLWWKLDSDRRMAEQNAKVREALR